MLSRSEMLLGKDALTKLKNSRIALFGVGGVGGFVAEALIRNGLGSLDVFDADTVDISNINRQIIADSTVIGESKVEVIKSIDHVLRVGRKRYLAALLEDRQRGYDRGKLHAVVRSHRLTARKLLFLSVINEDSAPTATSGIVPARAVGVYINVLHQSVFSFICVFVNINKA